MKARTNNEKKGSVSLPLCAFAALGGLSNGLLGSGGGLFLWLGLSKFSDCRKNEVFATGASVILFFSLFSAVAYLFTGELKESAFTPYLIPALAGGAVGAFLLSKIQLHPLRLLFAVVLLASGGILWMR